MQDGRVFEKLKNINLTMEKKRGIWVAQSTILVSCVQVKGGGVELLISSAPKKGGGSSLGQEIGLPHAP